MAGDSQVREDLGHVDVGQGVNGLQFDNQIFADQKVQLAFADGVPFVVDRDRRLPDEGYAPQLELDTHSLFINGFKKARAKYPVNFYRRPNDGVSKGVYFFARLPISGSLHSFILVVLGVLGVLAVYLRWRSARSIWRSVAAARKKNEPPRRQERQERQENNGQKQKGKKWRNHDKMILLILPFQSLSCSFLALLAPWR